MLGITSWGVWVPHYRLTSELVRPVFGGGGKASRAFASFDEDPVTMAVEAVRRAGGPADLLYFASNSGPYAEKQHAAIVAAAADWSHAAMTADWSGGLRAGTSALLGALDAVAAGRASRAVTVAAEMRPFEAGSAHELQFGDAAVALAVGENPVLALKASLSTNVEALDAWRRDGGAAVLESDAKFAEEQIYAVFQPEALGKALQKAGWKPADLTRAYLYAPDARQLGVIAKAAGLKSEQLPADTLYATVGSLGAVHPLAMLAADAPQWKPGDKLALCGHGSGADVILLEVTEAVRGAPVNAWNDAVLSSAPWPSYGALLQARGLIAGEKLEPFTAAPVWRREEAALLRRHAAVCVRCGRMHYPPQPACGKCHGAEFKPQRLGESGTVVTFTADHLYPAPIKPTVMVSADIDGGGRFYGQLADAHGQAVAIGDRVDFTFRRIHEGGGFVNYFWKFRHVTVA